MDSFICVCEVHKMLGPWPTQIKGTLLMLLCLLCLFFKVSLVPMKCWAMVFPYAYRKETNVRTQCICAWNVGRLSCCFVCGLAELSEQVSTLFVLELFKMSTHVVVLLFCPGQEVYELKMKAQQMF